jgi:hypothetical protein
MEITNANRTKSAITIASILIILFTSMLFLSVLGQASYISLVSVSMLAGFIIFFSDRIREINIKEFKVLLSEIKAAKEEVFAKEKEVKDIAFNLAKIIAFTSQVQGRMNNQDGHERWRKWYRYHLDRLNEITNFTNDETNEIYKISRMFDELDELLAKCGNNVSKPSYKEHKPSVDKKIEEINKSIEEDIRNK